MKNPKSSQLRALKRLTGSDDGLMKDELLKSPRMRVDGKPVASDLTPDDLVEMEGVVLVEKAEGGKEQYLVNSFARDIFPWVEKYYI